MEVITYSEWINQGNRQIAQEIALLAAQAGVDGVVDMDTYTNFPTEGADGLLYLAKDTGKLYTWNSTSKSYVRVDAGSDYVLPQATAEVLGGVKFGATSVTACVGNDSRLTNSRAPLTHTHGSIDNTGKIGATPNLVVVTGTGGLVSAKPAGTTNQYLRGDGSWETPPNTVSNISLETSTLTEAPEVSEGNGVIWYNSTPESKGFNITIKLAGLDSKTIELSSDAITEE